jgi:hypothetical protein
MIVEALMTLALAYTKPEYICVRWTWTGDVYNRKVYCVTWKKIEKEKKKDKND